MEMLGELKLAYLNILFHNLPFGNGKTQEKSRISQFLTANFISSLCEYLILLLK